jgi:hypothetical protein
MSHASGNGSGGFTPPIQLHRGRGEGAMGERDPRPTDMAPAPRVARLGLRATPSRLYRRAPRWRTSLAKGGRCSRCTSGTCQTYRTTRPAATFGCHGYSGSGRRSSASSSGLMLAFTM